MWARKIATTLSTDFPRTLPLKIYLEEEKVKDLKEEKVVKMGYSSPKKYIKHTFF